MISSTEQSAGERLYRAELISNSLCSCCPSSPGTTGPRRLPRLPSPGHSRARCSPSMLAGMRSRPRSTSSNTSKIRASKARHGRLLLRCCASLPQSVCQCFHARSCGGPFVAAAGLLSHQCSPETVAAGCPNTGCSQHEHQGALQQTGNAPVRVHVSCRLPPHGFSKFSNPVLALSKEGAVLLKHQCNV